MRFLRPLLTKEVQGKPGKFKPQAIGYDFRFAEGGNVDAVNNARDQFNSHFQTITAGPLAMASVNLFFQEAKTVSELLKKAQAEIQIRKAFEDEKTDLAKDLAIEQPEDIAFTVAFGGMNLSIDRKKLASGNFTGIIRDIKNSIESAMLEQVATASGVDPALVTLYEGLRAIKQVNNPEEFVELVGGIAVNAGTALNDVFKILKVTIKKLKYTSVPEEVLYSLEQHVERYQDENDIKMAVVADKVIHELENVSRRGLFSEDKEEREKIIALTNSVRHYLDELKKQVLAFNEKFDVANKRDKKALKQKAEINKALELTLQSFEERCRNLHFWKPLSHNILLGAVRKIESGSPSVIETYADIDISAWLSDKVRTASEKFDLKRALDADPEIAMAARTYVILKEHYGENLARNKKREKETFEEIKKEAAFLIALEAQQLRGIAAVKKIAGDLKFIFQQHQLHDATMSSNYYLLNVRKLAVAEALLRSFHLPVDQDEWNDEASFQLFYTEIMKGTRKIVGASFSKNVREVAQAKVLSLINTLGKLKSNGATDKDKNHNTKITNVISKIKQFYEKKFNDEKLTQDRITGEWIFIHADSVDSAVDSEDVNPASLVQAKVQKLLDYEISEREIQKQCIVEIEQYRDSLKSASTDQKKEVRLLAKQLRLLKHIYRDNPRENIIHKEVGDVSDLGFEINERVNGYFLAAKTFEKSREKDIAAKRAAVSKAFECAGASGAGVLADVSNNLRKKIENATKNAEALQSQLDDRHAAVEVLVSKGQQTVKPMYLNPRAAYLADITPEILDGFVARLNEAEQKLSVKVNPFIKVGSIVDDFFEERDKDKQKSLMSSSDKERQLYDIRLAREEVAITMLERLLLAQEGESADLVRQAGLVQGVCCEAYRLSSQQIVAYYDFIQRYGTLETKTKVSEKLVPVNHLLEKLSAPLENTWIDYQLALSSEDDDSIFSAAKKFAGAASFMIGEDDRKVLENLVSTAQETQELLQAYEERKKYDLRPLGGKFENAVAEQHYLESLHLQSHPEKMLKACKQKYCEKVKTFLSPSKIISSAWGAAINTQKNHIENELLRLEKTHGKKIAELHSKEKSLKNRVDSYENATAVGKFFRSITVSFKLGFPPISFSRSDNGEKRKNDLYIAESQCVAEETAYQEKKTALELERKRIEKNAKQMAQHLINTIRSEMKDAKIPPVTLKNAREFVTEHAPELLQKLDRESDFIIDFLEGIVEGEMAYDLKSAFSLIKKFNADVLPEAKIIIDLLQGHVPPLAEGSSLKSLVDQCMQALLKKSPIAEGNEIRLNRLNNAVYNNYVEPFIIDQATKKSLVDCEQLKSLLSLFNPVKKEIILRECVDIADKNEAALFHLFDALPAFCEAKNYESIRDALFKNYFDSQVTNILKMANQGSYNNESYAQDLSVLEAAKNAGTEVVATILDEAVSSLFAKQNGENAKVDIVWNENLAKLVEAYAKPETISQYRLLRLKELCRHVECQENVATAYEALDHFIRTMSEASGEDDVLFTIDQSFIHELVNSETPSWMAEAIVSRFGSENLLQMMHMKWIASTMARMSSGDYEETDKNETVLHQMILQRTEKNDFDKLEDFVGEIGVAVVKEGLQKISEDISTTHVKPALLVGDVNDVETLSQEAASNIKLAHSRLIQWLRSIPVLMRKPDSAATTIETLSDDPAVLRAFAEHDLNVLSKAYYHVSKEEVGMSAYVTLDLAHVNKILLLAPKLREKEKEIWIDNRRAEMRREAAIEHSKLLKENQDVSKKVAASKRALHSEEFAEEMIEYPFERFIQQMKLHWAENSKNEYNYHINPDIYYSHYLSLVQPIAERLVREKIMGEIFILVEKDKSDSALSKKILRALSEIDKKMILPISRLDENQVDPIVNLLEIDQAKKAYLRREMLAIAEKYNDAQAIVLMNWCAENNLSIPALPGFMNASKQAANLRDLMDCTFNYFALEDAFDNALADFEDKIEISALLNQVALLQDIRAFHERAKLKIDEWIEKACVHLSKLPLEPSSVFLQLLAFVDCVGTSEQKEKMRALVLTKKIADDFASDETRELLLSHAPLVLAVERQKEALSPVDGVVVTGKEKSSFDFSILKVAASQLLRSFSGNVPVDSYEFGSRVNLLRNIALYCRLFNDSECRNLFLPLLTSIVDKLLDQSLVVKHSTLESSSAGGDVRSLKYLAVLVADDYVRPYIDAKKMVAKILNSNIKENANFVKIMMPLLVTRAKQLFSAVGFAEEKEWKASGVKQFIPTSAVSMAGASAAAAMSINQKPPTIKEFQNILSLILAHGSPEDKEAIVNCSDITSTDNEKLQYFKRMQKELEAKKEPVKILQSSSKSAGLFGGPDNDKAEWFKLRDRYAAVAGTGWFSDTGKMFKENRPYLEVVQEMIDKVKNRSFKENKGSASYETLKVLKAERYFEIALKGKLKDLDVLDQKFPEFRDIVPKLKM